ncbi:hypothetical protein NXS98_04105 [Fontisphaera persica]|uniref:hypothetical protein n=1 Tax=Fontisphaera persica TaxID=2974023 RepID=UPI0024C0715A|nr:hypothetical protein [Fontisphaera persica]WCJ60324.1 hypothetical protein NXS98_04105 [Fontisphaera persica]
MGHSRIGTLPATRKWQEVVRLVADGADVGEVAQATLKAAEKAFSLVQKDAGFREAVNLLVEMGLAGGKADPTAQLAAAGIAIPESTSVVEVALAVGEALDQRVRATRDGQTFGEIAGKALVSAITSHLQERLHGLFTPTREDVAGALRDLGKKKEFGDLARNFMAKLTNEALGFFLTKTLGTQVGEGQRFATMNQMAQFEEAMRTHCEEASVIVQEFGADWFSKHRYEEGGRISRESAEGFGWVAMKKMKAELAMRAKSDGN